MLVQQTQETMGAAANSVTISDHTVDNSNKTGTCHSGAVFGSDGVLDLINGTGGTNAVSGQWLVTGSGSDFWVQHTVTAGNLQTEPGTGFNALTSDRTYESTKASAGIKTAIVYFEIASDSGGVTIVATATMTFICEQGSL